MGVFASRAKVRDTDLREKKRHIAVVIVSGLDTIANSVNGGFVTIAAVCYVSVSILSVINLMGKPIVILYLPL